VARGHDAKVVHPVKVKPLMRARSRNDKNDVYILAELLRSRCQEGSYGSSKDVREMRELTRHRKSLDRKKGDLKREVLVHLLQMDEPYEEDENVHLIRTIPGIGLVTASVIKAEVGDVTMFSSAENLAAYEGLTQLTKQSGEAWCKTRRTASGA